MILRVFPAKIYTSKQQHYVFGNRFELSVLIKFPLDFNSVIMIIFALQEKNPNMSISIFRF